MTPKWAGRYGIIYYIVFTEKYPAAFDLISSHSFCGTGLGLNLSGPLSNGKKP
jgi:hypothetical protein